MSVEKIDYAAIIADLESKRAALDNAIASLGKVKKTDDGKYQTAKVA